MCGAPYLLLHPSHALWPRTVTQGSCPKDCCMCWCTRQPPTSSASALVLRNLREADVYTTIFISSSSIHYNSCLHYEVSACKFAFMRCGRSHTYHSVSFTVITDTTSSGQSHRRVHFRAEDDKTTPHRGQVTCDGSATRARALLAPRSLRLCASLLLEMGWPLPLLPPLPHISPQHTSGLTCHH